MGLRALVENAAPLNIAAGEYCYVLDDAKLLIEAHAVDVLQADVTRCGGISNFLKIADACEMYHLPLPTPHPRFMPHWAVLSFQQ